MERIPPIFNLQSKIFNRLGRVFLKHHPPTFQALTQKAEKVGILAFGVIEAGENPESAFATLDGAAQDDLTALDQVAYLQTMGHFAGKSGICRQRWAHRLQPQNVRVPKATVRFCVGGNRYHIADLNVENLTRINRINELK